MCLSAAARPHYCTDPDVTWENGGHYWADLQSVHGLRYYDNIAPRVLAVGADMTAKRRTRSVSEYMLVLALCQRGMHKLVLSLHSVCPYGRPSAANYHHATNEARCYSFVHWGNLLRSRCTTSSSQQSLPLSPDFSCSFECFPFIRSLNGCM